MARRKTDPVMEECMALCYISSGDFVARQALWQTLWQKYMEGEDRSPVSADAAYLLTRDAAYLALHRHDYEAAMNYIESFLSHPEFDQLDYVWKSNLWGWQFLCLLFMNRETEALQVAASMLQAERRIDVRTFVMDLQHNLYTFCEEQNQNDMASEAVTHLVYDLIERRQRKQHKAMPRQARYGELRETTFAFFEAVFEAGESARAGRLRREAARLAEDAPRSGSIREGTM